MTQMIFELQATTCSAWTYTTQSNAIPGAAVSGVLWLGSSLWSGYIVSSGGSQSMNFFTLPKGNTLRIHETKIYGGGVPATVNIAKSNDYGSNWSIIASDNYNGYLSGNLYEFVIKHTGRPIEVKSFDGNVMVQFAYNMPSTTSAFTLVAEYVCEMVENECVSHFYPHS